MSAGWPQGLEGRMHMDSGNRGMLLWSCTGVGLACRLLQEEHEVWWPSVFWRHWWHVMPLTLSYTRLPVEGS